MLRRAVQHVRRLRPCIKKCGEFQLLRQGTANKVNWDRKLPVFIRTFERRGQCPVSARALMDKNGYQMLETG